MKFVRYLLILAICRVLLGASSIFGLYEYMEPQLPDVTTLKDVCLQISMRVYSVDDGLIVRYSGRRRILVALQQVPPELVKVFIATEDSHFYEYRGIDPVSIFRAASAAMLSSHVSRGVSTIAQQLACNFFLNPEKALVRKTKEALLTIRIERLLNRDEILELYLNKTYLGYRVYDVDAAAQIYLGKPINQLTLSEMAVIVGLPRAPSTFNPLYPMSRVTTRRNVVPSRMLNEGYTTQVQYDEARSGAIDASYHASKITFSAPYLSEVVCQEMVDRYDKQAYEDGYRVYTIITHKDQQTAQQAARNSVPDYDICHGYRGLASVLQKVGGTPWETRKIIGPLRRQSGYGPLLPAVVISANAQEAVALLANDDSVSLTMDGVRWVRRFISDTQQRATPRKVDDVLRAGQQIQVRKVADSW